MRCRLAPLLLLCCPQTASAVVSINVCDGLASAAFHMLGRDGARVTDNHYSSAELAAGALAEYDAVIVRSATKLDAAAIREGAAGRLKVIARAGVGVDNVDLEVARSCGCYVLNTPTASTASVVEMTLAHMLAAARGLQAADAGLKGGQWLKGQLRPAHELAGKRLGLLGFGRVAKGVARAASALGMHVCAHSSSTTAAAEEAAGALGVTLLPSADELFRECTHVAVLCSLTAETRGMVDERRLALMPQTATDGTACGAHLFNMARGGIVSEADAAAALQAGVLATYATDVFEIEPPSSDLPLLQCEHGFYGTPHIGGATMEAQARVGTLIAEAVLAALEHDGEPPSDSVVVAPFG
jgi:D-3-phosphoglycerate dehydrogenase